MDTAVDGWFAIMDAQLAYQTDTNQNFGRIPKTEPTSFYQKNTELNRFMQILIQATKMLHINKVFHYI